MLQSHLVQAAALFLAAYGPHGAGKLAPPPPPPEIAQIVAAARAADGVVLRRAFEQALAACKGLPGHADCDAAAIARQAVGTFGMGKQPPTEIRIWKAAVAASQHSGGDATDCYLGLGRLQGYLGKLPEAEAAYRRAIEVARRVRGANDESVAEVLHEAGLLVAASRRWATAERFLQDALAVMGASDEAKSPQTALILQDLATLRASAGRLGEAEEACRRALAIREEVASDDLEGLSGTLQCLGGILAGRGAHAEAVPLYARTLALLEKELGADHPLLLESLSGLARSEAELGKDTEARDHFMRAAVIERRDVPESTRVRLDYAAFLRTRGEPAAADTLEAEAKAASAPPSKD